MYCLSLAVKSSVIIINVDRSIGQMPGHSLFPVLCIVVCVLDPRTVLVLIKRKHSFFILKDAFFDNIADESVYHVYPKL